MSDSVSTKNNGMSLFGATMVGGRLCLRRFRGAGRFFRQRTP